MRIDIPEPEEYCPRCEGIRSRTKCDRCNGERVVPTESGEAILALVKRHLPRLLRELQEEQGK